MSPLTRPIATLALCAVGVAALTVAGWSRSRHAHALELARPTSVASLLDLPRGEAPTWRVIAEATPDTPATAYWFAHDDGRLAGPWRPGRAVKPHGIDRAGWLVATVTTADDRPPLEVVRYDPATGRSQTALSLPNRRPSEGRLSRDLTTLAVGIGGDPLRFDIYDADTGHLRSRLTLTDRRGSIDPNDRVVAALEWAVSHDGSRLVLTEGWDGPKRTTPAGIEVRDTVTGGVVRRIPHEAPCGPAIPPQPAFGFQEDLGAVGLSLTPHGDGVCYAVEWRRSGPPASWWEDPARKYVPGMMCANLVIEGFRQSCRIDLQRPGTGEVMKTHWWDGHPRIYFEYFESADAFRRHGCVAWDNWLFLAATDPQSRTAWHTYDQYRPVPGRTRPELVFRASETEFNDDPPVLKWLLRRQQQRTPYRTVTRYTYHDAVSGGATRFEGATRYERVKDYQKETQDTFAVGPDNLLILVNHEGRAELSQWDLPPRPSPYPWRWSVPGGVALGLALAAGVWTLKNSGRLRSRLAGVLRRG